MKNYILFLDDERMPRQVTWSWMPSHVDWHWTIVRNYDEFVKCIEENGLPDFVTFDHDLSIEHYKEGFAGAEPKYGEYKEKTGYHCAEWLVHYCVNNNLPVPMHEAHTMNQVGKINILRALAPENVARMREILRNQ